MKECDSGSCKKSGLKAKVKASDFGCIYAIRGVYAFGKKFLNTETRSLISLSNLRLYVFNILCHLLFACPHADLHGQAFSHLSLDFLLSNND